MPRHVLCGFAGTCQHDSEAECAVNCPALPTLTLDDFVTTNSHSKANTEASEGRRLTGIGEDDTTVSMSEAQLAELHLGPVQGRNDGSAAAATGRPAPCGRPHLFASQGSE